MADKDMINENLNDVDIESGNALLDTEEVQPSSNRDKSDSTTPVEDLPLQDRITLAKNGANPFGALRPGAFLDALDSINAWCVASIVEVDENMIKVHFDGWPNKWDEWMRITSYKIAPFRKHSIGYTGQTKVAIRKIDFTTEDYEMLIDKIDSLIKNNLKGLGPSETTQFYRGTIFTTLDHLMGKSYEINEIEEFEVAIKFIKKVIEMISTYLKLIPSLLSKFSDFKREADLYLVDENIAIALCYQEFIEMLKIIFCGNPRILKFYLKHDREPIKPKTTICKPYQERDLDMQKGRGEDLDFEEIRDLVSKKKELDFGLFHEFLDHFQLHGGFDNVRKAIKCVLPQENGLTLPFDLVPIITSPFKNGGSIINQKYSKEMAEEIQSVVLNRLESMNDDEMKEIERGTIHSLLIEMREFLGISLDESSVDEKLESVKLSMALRFLKSTVMKKRLAGINEIKSIIEMTADNSRSKWANEDSPRKAKWVKPDYLCRWISDNKLVEYLLGESSHVELIKRSASVLRFLSIHKQLTKDHLELLWKEQEGKHEANVLGVFETIIEIGVDLSIESIEFIFSKIMSIPIKKYNEHILNFVKDFTTNALQVYKNSERTELIEISSDDEENKQQELYFENAKSYVNGKEITDSDKTPEYGLPIIYEIVLQNNELSSSALKALLELLKQKCGESLRMKYILKCIRSLRSGVATYQSISIISAILPRGYSSK